MRAIIDIMGQRFGRLLVMEPAGMDSNRAMTWRVRCDCGTEFITRGKALRYGSPKSCGCWKPRVDQRRKEHA